jgi:hypothetical protein
MHAIVLDYELSWNRRASEVDLRTADETALRYRCFLGDVVFLVDESDFSARWGWVPILDFAMSLRTMAGGLVDGPSQKQSFEFTESDAELVFEREGSMVKIEANYVPVTAEVPHVDLSVDAERFLARVIRELERSYPALAENAFVAGLLRDLAVPP